jgi:hypothetical protein
MSRRGLRSTPGVWRRRRGRVPLGYLRNRQHPVGEIPHQAAADAAAAIAPTTLRVVVSRPGAVCLLQPSKRYG